MNTLMYDPMQSAYKLVHSTETALVKINYDTHSSLYAEKCTVLVSLDVSAAFDTINHNVFLNRLQYMYGITGTAFKWFQSYIEQRNNQVCVGLPFTKTASSIRRTTGFSVGCQTVYHVHQPINFQQTQGGVP